MLDQNQDSKYSKDDIINFCNIVSSIISPKQTEEEFSSEVTSFAILKMWQAISIDRESFLRWLVRSIIIDHRVDVQRNIDTIYVSVDVISILYEIFDVPQMFEDVNVQQLIDLMQEAGKEDGSMDPSDPQMRNVIPANIVRMFAESFVDGFSLIISRLGFDNTIFVESKNKLPVRLDKSQYDDINLEEDFEKDDDSADESFSD